MDLRNPFLEIVTLMSNRGNLPALLIDFVVFLHNFLDFNICQLGAHTPCTVEEGVRLYREGVAYPFGSPLIILRTCV